MANKIPRVSVREQEPAVRATNFEGYAMVTMLRRPRPRLRVV